LRCLPIFSIVEKKAAAEGADVSISEREITRTVAQSAAAAVAQSAAAAREAKAEKEARNKRLILEYYDLALNKRDFAAARQFIGANYTQHNPDIADGPEGLEAFIKIIERDLPNLRVEFLRVIADGDFVITHNHGYNSPGDMAVVDIFRIEDGKVVEHWDVLQPVPVSAANPNGMF
jgi:predicted SnoaL-like aldol condensation-catalyzing enzyme